MSYTVGDYLAERFVHMGLKHHFVVPGDYNLVLLDKLVTNKKMKQIGCVNELNASYAAEGYARVNGAAAVVVTYNVGAFSALNGIAGAFAERVPVIFISGSYNTNDEPMGDHILHHTIGVHDLYYQFDMIKRITCDAVRILHAREAPHLIDRAIRNALRHRLPAYIEIPCNVAGLECSHPTPFNTMFNPPKSDPEALEAAVEAVAAKLNDARAPVLLAGPHIRSYGAIEEFKQLAEAIGCAVAVQPNAKSFFPETHPQFAGIYWGAVSTPGCNDVVDWSDLILAAGPVYTDYSTVGWTAQPEDIRTINVYHGRVRTPEDDFSRVEIPDFLSALSERVKKNSASLEQFNRTREEIVKPKRSDKNAPLTRLELISQIEELMDNKSTLLVETGDSWFNGMFVRLPENARFEIEMQWGSIGWAVPASFGYSLGLEPGRRLISLIGDGSFQLTAQEVSNMIRYKTNNIIFLVNNRGYVIESEIHDGPYNYFKNWDYAGLIDVFNAEDGKGLALKASSGGALANAIEKAKAYNEGPVLIECEIAHNDCSRALLEWGTKVGAANSRQPILG